MITSVLMVEGDGTKVSYVPDVLFLCAFCAFLWLFFLRGALILSDRLGFGNERVAKRAEHLQHEIEFSQTLSSRTNRTKKELELNTSTTISDRQHVMAPLIFTPTTRFNFRQNM